MFTCWVSSLKMSPRRRKLRTDIPSPGNLPRCGRRYPSKAPFENSPRKASLGLAVQGRVDSSRLSAFAQGAFQKSFSCSLILNIPTFSCWEQVRISRQCISEPVMWLETQTKSVLFRNSESRARIHSEDRMTPRRMTRGARPPSSRHRELAPCFLHYEPNPETAQIPFARNHMIGFV